MQKQNLLLLNVYSVRFYNALYRMAHPAFCLYMNTHNNIDSSESNKINRFYIRVSESNNGGKDITLLDSFFLRMKWDKKYYN